MPRPCLRPGAALLAATATVSAFAVFGTPASATAPPAAACEPIAGPAAAGPAAVDASPTEEAPPADSSTTASSSDDSAAATSPGAFGPLALEPAMRISLLGGEFYDADRVPGGIVVTSGPELTPNAVTFVEDSGTIRWRACFDNTPWIATTPTDPASLLVSVSTFEEARDPILIDLATGAGGPSAALPAGQPHYPWAYDAAQGLALFGPTPEAFDLPASSDLTLVDLASDTATVVRSPEIPASVTGPTFGIGTDGIVGLFGLDIGSTAVALAYVDGAWTDDPAVIDATFPVWTNYEASVPISFRRASGVEAWSVGDLFWASSEGFHSLQVDRVTLIRGCTDPGAVTYNCGGPHLLAVDAASGSELWRQAGGSVIDAADGHALIGTTGPDGSFAQTMIDVATGQPVDGQVWSGDEPTFLVGCCGDPAFTEVDGDSVVTSDGGTLELYVPLAEATSTVDVAL